MILPKKRLLHKKQFLTDFCLCAANAQKILLCAAGDNAFAASVRLGAFSLIRWDWARARPG
jgi:hypothetical protein